MSAFTQTNTMLIPLRNLAERILEIYKGSLKPRPGHILIRKGRLRPYRTIDFPVYPASAEIRNKSSQLDLIQYLRNTVSYLGERTAIVNQAGDEILSKQAVEKAHKVLRFPEEFSGGGREMSEIETAFLVVEYYVQLCFAEFSAFQTPGPTSIRLLRQFVKEHQGTPLTLDHSVFEAEQQELFDDLENQFGFLRGQIRKFQLFSQNYELPVEPEWLTYHFQRVDQGEVFSVIRGRDHRILEWERIQNAIAEKAAEENERRRCT